MSPTDKFQELICVLRDWDPAYDQSYLYGPRSGERYLNKLGNHELNKYFESLYCYLMPSAGSAHKRSTVEFNRLSDQFLTEMSNLIRLKLLNIDEMAVKKDSRIGRTVKPDQLNKLFKVEINKLNGMADPIVEMADSADNWERLESESIKVLDDYSDEDI